MPLTFNGTDQFLQFSPDFTSRPDSSVVVNVSNPADAAKLFDTANGDINVVSNDVTLSNVKGVVLQIGRNLTAGTFYSGDINSISFLNPDQGRTFTTLDDLRDAVITLPLSGPQVFVEFSLIVSAGSFINNGIVNVVITGGGTGGFRFDDQVFGFEDDVEFITYPLPLELGAIYKIRYESDEPGYQIYVDDVLKVNHISPFPPQLPASFDFIGAPIGNSSTNLSVYDLFINDITQDITAQWDINETSGVAILADTALFDTEWEAVPVRIQLTVDNSNFPVDEDSGDTIDSTEGNSNATIQNFNENMWSGGDPSTPELVKKIRQSIMVIDF